MARELFPDRNVAEVYDTASDTEMEFYYRSPTDYYLRDVCRATSAAPTYFPPARITSLAGDEAASEVSPVLEDGGDKAGLTYPVVMYDIRHLFATTLLREGGDVAAVSKLMGHASVKMTVDQYYRLFGDGTRRTY